MLGGLLGWLGRVWHERTARRELFDHRLRLEKEYGICSDLWDRLFEFRRTAGALASLIDDAPDEDPDEAFANTFNSLQEVVRRNEPFVPKGVYEPAREVVRLGREMKGHTKRRALLQQRDHDLSAERDEGIAQKLILLEEAMSCCVAKIDEQYSVVREAIRNRMALRA